MARLTASVVGGGAGGKLSMTALHDSERFELVAVADVKPEVCEALAEQYPGIRTFTNHEELFATCPTDVVCVSTVTYAQTRSGVREEFKCPVLSNKE